MTTTLIILLGLALIVGLVLTLDWMERRRRKNERRTVRRIVQYLEMTRPRPW